jgi:hypothetical protein
MRKCVAGHFWRDCELSKPNILLFLSYTCSFSLYNTRQMTSCQKLLLELQIAPLEKYCNLNFCASSPGTFFTYFDARSVFHMPFSHFVIIALMQTKLHRGSVKSIRRPGEKEEWVCLERRRKRWNNRFLLSHSHPGLVSFHIGPSFFRAQEFVSHTKESGRRSSICFDSGLPHWEGLNIGARYIFSAIRLQRMKRQTFYW